MSASTTHVNLRLPVRFVNRAVAAVYVLLLFGYPFVASLPGFLPSVNVTTVSIGMRAGLAGLSLLVIWRIGIRQQRFHWGWFFIAFLVFWGLYIGRVLVDVVYSPIELRIPRYEYLLFSVGGALLPALALSTKISRSTFERVFEWVFVAAAVVGLTNSFAVQEAISSGDLTRVQTTALNPISLSNVGASMVILASYGTFRPEMLPQRWKRMLIPVMFGGGLGYMLLGTARGPFVALLCVFGALFLIRGTTIGRKVKRSLLLGALIAAAGTAAFWYFGDVIQEFVLRFMWVRDVADSSTQTRVQLWTRAWSQFMENPLTGSAIVERVRVLYPHNLIIESFMAIGIFGGLLCMGIVVMSALSALRVLRAYPERAWVALLFIQYLVGAMFSGSIWSSGIMWGLMAATVAQSAPRS